MKSGLRIVQVFRLLVAALDRWRSTPTAPDIGQLICYREPHDAHSIEDLIRLVLDEDIATPEEIRAARDQYAMGSDNDIEVDDVALASRADDGVWVQAWVWLPSTDKEPV
jgi:hypothetical protein